MSDAQTLVSRRQFCAGACQVASCATLATLVSACGGDSPTSPSGPTRTLTTLPGQFSGSTVKVTTTGTALADVGGAAVVDSVAGLFLISKSNATSFIAIDAVCTHEGCTVTGANDNEYICPCHGSRYDRSGHVTNGPAKANLRQYATSFADGVVTITV